MKKALIPRVIAAAASAILTVVVFDQVARRGMPESLHAAIVQPRGSPNPTMA